MIRLKKLVRCTALLFAEIEALVVGETLDEVWK